ncbi:MAG: autotransporter outer membrane beta-barrel domain-containing protein [Planctomycetaceae bacterium]|nr:autotransporter outer membrane beta-barrel domain-containing protein [Planctomycetales bacterium]MCB9941624.1 autotransporter outer membrane beta-barrel domain-containing protein [Planctomycetaceae bacterium]
MRRLSVAFCTMLLLLGGVRPSDVRGVAIIADPTGSQIFPTASTVTVAGNMVFTNTIVCRLGALRQVGPNVFAPPMRVLSNDRSALRLNSILGSASSDDSSCGQARYGWVRGYGVAADLRAGAPTPDAEFNAAGITAGFERFLNDQTVVGLSFGYAGSTTDLDVLRSKAEGDSFHLGTYMRHIADYRYTIGVAAYSHTEFDTTRYLSTPDPPTLGDFGADGLSLYLERGRIIDMGDWEIKPFGNVQYFNVRRHGFTETGGGPANIAVAGATSEALLLGVGARGHRSWTNRDCLQSTLEVRARWNYEALQRAPIVTGTTGAPFATPITMTGVGGDQSFGLAGVGLIREVSSRAQMFINYDLQFGDNVTAHIGSFGGLLNW